LKAWLAAGTYLEAVAGGAEACYHYWKKMISKQPCILGELNAKTHTTAAIKKKHGKPTEAQIGKY